MSTMNPTESNSAELLPGSREACGYLTVKYGFQNLERLKSCYSAVPDMLPRQHRLKMISEMMDFPASTLDGFIDDFEKLVPAFLQKLPFDANVLVLAPPVLYCVKNCRYVIGANKGMLRPLAWHRSPTEVTVFCGAGVVKRGLAVTLRCQGCQSRYSHSTWTDHDSATYSFYDTEREYLDISQEIYVSRPFAKEIVNQMLFNHATYDGVAETMKQTYHWDSRKSAQYYTDIQPSRPLEYVSLTLVNDNVTRAAPTAVCSGSIVFSRKTVAATFLRHEIECDIREYGLHPYRFGETRSILQYLQERMDAIFSSVYDHDCSDKCRSLQCGKLFILDGLWKIVFRHCTAHVKNVVEDIPLINFPSVCTNAPAGTSLTCLKHRHLAPADMNNAPTSIHITGVTKALRSKAILDINQLLDGEIAGAPDESICRKFDPNAGCAKNKGQNERGHLYSRGYLFLVGPTGHIHAFSPLYRAESLGQVFLFTISTLYQLLQSVPVDEWQNIFISYDNICQLNRLKAANMPLPLEPPYDAMWARISKIIDGLHIQNHKDQKCHRLYHPDRFYAAHPEASSRNTMAAEQTFAWMAKFRKQLNAMCKARQFFFVHRMIIRRNAYVSRCLRDNTRPVGGTMRAFADR